MIRKTREERKAETRQALLDAAASVVVERGLAGASVEAICAAAGFTRGAFYSNFESKEQLFVELLQQRVYEQYRGMAEQRIADPGARPTLRETGEELGRMQADPRGRWLLRLILELLAEAGRNDRVRELAATFWAGTRELTAHSIKEAAASAGEEPAADPRMLATALIALDIGLALQHYVDPKAAPLSVYPELYELLFGPLDPGRETG
ncbi:MAG TPA: TetR family transcriptional regulator [Thermoleophilaceae bacterium]